VKINNKHKCSKFVIHFKVLIVIEEIIASLVGTLEITAELKASTVMIFKS
jgi:hypothetical protein